jgi:hypothetical protein
MPGPAEAKRWLTAQLHFGRFEGLLLEGSPFQESLFEESLRESSPSRPCHARWIPSIPRNEQWMVRPYIRPRRPQPHRSVRTPPLPITPPAQHPHRAPEPMLPSERTREILPPQQQAFSSVFPGSAPGEAATTELRLFEGSICWAPSGNLDSTHGSAGTLRSNDSASRPIFSWGFRICSALRADPLV